MLGYPPSYTDMLYTDMILYTLRRIKNERAEKMGSPKSILTEAETIVNGARAQDYGPKESFDKIARVASDFTNKELTGTDICKILVAVKLVRESFKHKRDNLVDLCGYAELLSRLEGGE